MQNCNAGVDADADADADTDADAWASSIPFTSTSLRRGNKADSLTRNYVKNGCGLRQQSRVWTVVSWTCGYFVVFLLQNGLAAHIILSTAPCAGEWKEKLIVRDGWIKWSSSWRLSWTPNYNELTNFGDGRAMNVSKIYTESNSMAGWLKHHVYMHGFDGKNLGYQQCRHERVDTKNTTNGSPVKSHLPAAVHLLVMRKKLMWTKMPTTSLPPVSVTFTVKRSTICDALSLGLAVGW